MTAQDTTSVIDVPTVDLVARAMVRLIPTAFYKPPVLEALADTADDVAALADLEALTSRRLIGQRDGLADLDARELAFRAREQGLRRWGSTHVNAAFLYTRPGGNRFNDHRRGAWYCAFDDLTALEEVGYHRTRELRFTRHFHDEVCYQALLADFIGPFADLRSVDPKPDCLNADPETGYPAGQTLAAALRSQGHAGLIYPSARYPGGECLVAFVPQIVQNVRPGAKWWLKWDGSPEYTVTAAD